MGVSTPGVALCSPEEVAVGQEVGVGVTLGTPAAPPTVMEADRLGETEGEGEGETEAVVVGLRV